MCSRCEQRCFIKILVARGENASQCFRALQESFGREVLHCGTITRSVKAFRQAREECKHRACAGRPVAATDELHVQAVRVLLEEDRRWTCVEISRELGMYVYLRFKCASTSQIIGAHNEWLWMIMMAKWYSGTLGPKASWHLSYRWGKTPKKPHLGNLSRPGIEPGPAAWQVCMVPLVSLRWTGNLVL